MSFQQNNKLVFILIFVIDDTSIYKTYVTKFVLYLILFIQLGEWILSKKKKKLENEWELREGGEFSTKRELFKNKWSQFCMVTIKVWLRE